VYRLSYANSYANPNPNTHAHTHTDTDTDTHTHAQSDTDDPSQLDTVSTIRVVGQNCGFQYCGHEHRQ
jgi:hypothetical protein